MDKDQQGIVQSAVDALASQPCLLGIVLVVAMCLAFLSYTLREQRKMEETRVRQFLEATGQTKKKVKK